ncbi:MAG: GAF domain-containing protein [Bryobacterales bacterium]|nr:GAF domain-containing protein [Bryobacterales bacterium]
MNLQEQLESIVREFNADSGTIHLMGEDDQLHLAASFQIPEVVLDRVRIVPIGKGMAGLAAERRQPVTVCNIQTDTSGDVRPGAKLTGMEGAIALPMLDDTGKVGGVLGVANRAERTFTTEEEHALMKKGTELLLSPR